MRKIQTYLQTNFEKEHEEIITHEYLPPMYQLCVKIKRLPVPQEEETTKYKTKIENADGALHRNVNYGQRNPVEMLKYKNL